jgi:hypothetical protein
MSDTPNDDEEVPVYDEGDPDGDRREFIDSPEHVNNPDLFPDEEPA